MPDPTPTWTLLVPEPDNHDSDDAPTAPGLRWCSLWGPRGPCHPSIEGTADEWLTIAGVIEARRFGGYERVAFTPTDDGGGSFRSPRNTTSERDHVVLAAAELADLVRSIREQLSPAVCLGCAAEHGQAFNLRDLGPACARHAAAPVHPMAEDGSGPTTGAITFEPATADGIFAALGEMAPPAVPPSVPESILTMPMNAAAVAAGLAPAPAGRPPGVPTSAPARFVALDAAEVNDRPAAFFGADDRALAVRWAARCNAKPSRFERDAPDDARPGDVAVVDTEPQAPPFDINGDPNGPACSCEPGKLDPECGHQADQDRRDADAIVRVLHRGFLAALRSAVDRIVTPRPAPGAPTGAIDPVAIAAHFDDMAACDGTTGKEREVWSYCAEVMRAEARGSHIRVSDGNRPPGPAPDATDGGPGR